MEQDLIEGMKHMRLTKEEEVHILVSGEGRFELLVECSLSLDGVFANKHEAKQASFEEYTSLGMESGPRSEDCRGWKQHLPIQVFK